MRPEAFACTQPSPLAHFQLAIARAGRAAANSSIRPGDALYLPPNQHGRDALADDWPWITRMKSSILQFLKTSGEQLDAQIAQALRMPMTTVRRQVSQLAASGEVICCKVTRYADGKKIEGVSCRLAGRLPVPSRGPTPGAT